MSRVPAPLDEFDDALLDSAAREDAPRLLVDLDGYEGPLDLLLDLARRNKLDLRSISILSLADQYLSYIHEAKRLRLEVAGDYLVMAAWLAYLKSRLLLPEKLSADEPSVEGLAEALADKLKRLASVRALAERLTAMQDALGSRFPRGAGEAVIVARSGGWEVSLHELVGVYIERRKAGLTRHYVLAKRKTLSIPEAREILERLIGSAAEWCPISVLVAAISPVQADRRSATASSFVAALELAREGKLALRQEAIFAPILLRRTVFAGSETTE